MTIIMQETVAQIGLSGSVARRCEGTIISEEMVVRLRGTLRNQSKECVMETLGVSSNTWTKIKRGQPIRRSIAEALLMRFDLATT